MIKKNEVQIIGNKKIKNAKITTAPYPGFPTDLQAQIMVLLCKAKVKFKFLFKPEFIENETMFIFRENNAKGVGKIINTTS